MGAIEWLSEQLPQIDWDDPFYVGLLQEAKRMDYNQIKEQIKDAYNIGYADATYRFANDSENYANKILNK